MNRAIPHIKEDDIYNINYLLDNIMNNNLNHKELLMTLNKIFNLIYINERVPHGFN